MSAALKPLHPPLSHAILEGIVEVAQTHNGLYRIADTTLVFHDSPALLVTKNVIKGFQIFPDTQYAVNELLTKGRVKQPFLTGLVFIRNVVVLIEVVHFFNPINRVSSEDNPSEIDFISDLASVMHISVMSGVAYYALDKLSSSYRLPLARLRRPDVVYERRKSRLALSTAVTKIVQQSFILAHSSYAQVLQLLTLIFNVCAIVSCVFSTNAVRKHYRG